MYRGDLTNAGAAFGAQVEHGRHLAVSSPSRELNPTLSSHGECSGVFRQGDARTVQVPVGLMRESPEQQLPIRNERAPVPN